MVQSIEAVFSDGAFRPQELVRFREGQRVRLTVESLEPPAEGERAAAMERLRQGIAQMNFRSTGPYPTRDELHERR